MTSKNKKSAFIKKETIKEQRPSFSEFFQLKRKSAMMSLSELSKKTGISVKNLKNIEQGEWSNLPAKIYVLNFLSKCAKLFKISESDFLNLYEKEFKYNNDFKLKKISKKSFIVTPRIVVKVVFIFFIVFVLFYFLFQLNYLIGEPKLIIFQPERDLITKSKEILIKGQTQRDNKVVINENEVFVNNDGNFSEYIPLQLGMNFVKIKAINKLNKESIIIKRIILKE